MRKMRVQTVSICGVEGKGPTKRGAREDADRQIRQAFADNVDYTPSILSFRGNACLVWRSIGGYCSAMIYPDVNGRIGSACYYSADLTREKVLQSCRVNLAQLGWDGVEDSSPFLGGAAEQDDFHRWVRFQRTYKVARDQGLGDVEAHRIACAA